MIARFGVFELHMNTGELRRDGRSVRLAPQPARALGLLVSRPGVLVSREELIAHVWDDGTHVDYASGLNFCLAAIRTALGDSAAHPRYVRTIPRRGYAFIAPVALEADEGASPSPRLHLAPAAGASVRRWLLPLVFASAAALVMLVAGALRAPAPAADMGPPSGYDAYLRGRYLLHKGTLPALQESVAAFEEAASRDSRYAPALAGLASAWNLVSSVGGVQFDGYARAEAAARRALALDARNAEAHAALGYARLGGRWDFAGADAELSRALSLDPTLAIAHGWRAQQLSALGRHDAALAEVGAAQRLDPFSLDVNGDLGWDYYYARRYDDAIRQCGRTVRMEPTFGPASGCLTLALLARGSIYDAIGILLGAPSIDGRRDPLARAFASGGPPAFWSARLQTLETRRRSGASVADLQLALLHARLGQNAQALDSLEAAYAHHTDRLIFLNVWPTFDGLRHEARFQSLLQRIGIPHAAAGVS